VDPTIQDEFDFPLFNVKTDGLHIGSNTTFEQSVTFLGPVYGLDFPTGNTVYSLMIDGGTATTTNTTNNFLSIDFGGSA